MNLTKNIVILVLSCGVFSCSGQTADQPGSLSHHHSCAADPDIKYTLFLPSGYQNTQQLPVFIAFDPAGKGEYPVMRYQDIASKRRIIIMGSENSRNGQDFSMLRRIATAMVREAETRFHADSSRLFLMGFSGGARASVAIGLYITKVKGIIGCSAGFPGSPTRPFNTFDFYGIAGDCDFILPEMIDLDKNMTMAGWPHEIAIVQGGHNWPDSTMMDHAIQWILGNRSEHTLGTPDYAQIYGTEKEEQLGKELRDHFNAPDTVWWKQRISNLKNHSNSDRNPRDTLMDHRLLGLVGMMSYIRSVEALQGNSKDLALRMLTVYRYAEPENPAVDSLFQIYYKKNGAINGK